jgi:hypothetical protein
MVNGVTSQERIRSRKVKVFGSATLWRAEDEMAFLYLCHERAAFRGLPSFWKHAIFKISTERSFEYCRAHEHLPSEDEMTRRCAARNRLVDAASALWIAGAVFLIVMPLQSIAQGPEKSPAAAQGAPGASGTIIVPPATDPGMAKQAPSLGDPQAVKPPPIPVEPDAVRKTPKGKDVPKPKENAGTPDGKQRAARNAVQSKGGEAAPQVDKPPSGKDNCQGPAELCKQDSAR